MARARARPAPEAAVAAGVLRIRATLDPWKSGEFEPSNEEDADLQRSGKNELGLPVDLARGNRHESDEADAA